MSVDQATLERRSRSAARRVAAREALPIQAKPAQVTKETLWKRGEGPFLFVDRILGAKSGEAPWVEFSDGDQAFVHEMLSDEWWVYFGPGPDPERDLDDRDEPIAADLASLGVVGQHIVRTVRAVHDDLEPRSLPAIPRGTFGIASDDAEDYGTVDFGAPWGFQRVGNHDLVDAPAVLLNAMRAIVVLGRPWRSVIRRTLRSFADPYLVTAAGGGDFAVEAHLAGEGRRAGLRLLAETAELASKPINKAWAREQAAHFIAKSGEQRAT